METVGNEYLADVDDRVLIMVGNWAGRIGIVVGAYRPMSLDESSNPDWRLTVELLIDKERVTVERKNVRRIT